MRALSSTPVQTKFLNRAFTKAVPCFFTKRAKNSSVFTNALVKTEEFFALLVKKQGTAFVKALFKNLVWTGVEDNARILGLAGSTNHYERVYKRFDGIYRKIGALANPNSPVINPSDSFDYRYIKALVKASPSALGLALTNALM